MGDIGTFIKELDPQFEPVVLNGTKEAIKLIASKKGLNEDAKRLLTNQITAELYNRVADLGYTHFDRDQWIAWGKGLAEQAVSGAIFLSNPRNDPSKASKAYQIRKNR